MKDNLLIFYGNLLPQARNDLVIKKKKEDMLGNNIS
jgi:hypothetical protein